jgi:hypothetical protein
LHRAASEGRGVGPSLGALDAEPDQQLVIYTAEPGSRSEEAVRELAAWAAEHIGASD